MTRRLLTVVFPLAIALIAATSGLMLLVNDRAVPAEAAGHQSAGQPSIAEVSRRTAVPLRPFASEEIWLMADVTAALEGMVTPSANEVVRRPRDLEATDRVWSPDTYVASIRSGLGVTPAQAGVDYDVRTPLTSLAVDAFLDQNERLSQVLGADPRSASAHESAALLVGAFALRESSGMFGDVRPTLSRMTAHLAMAQALRGPGEASIDGELAQTVLSVLIGHQRQALSRLDRLQRRLTTEGGRAWSRALRFRITGDWRPIDPSLATVLERVECARAIHWRVGYQAFLEFLDRFDADDITDWQRIATSNWPSVEEGHRFAAFGVKNDLAEASHVWRRMHGGNEPPADFVDALNEAPGATPVWIDQGKTTASILDWGAWAAFEQRNLIQSLVGEYRYYYMLGKRQRQAPFVADMQSTYSRLALYPLAARAVADTADRYLSSMATARHMADTAPERISYAAWRMVAAKPDFVNEAAAFPFDVNWFVRTVPAGTAFDLGVRALAPGCPRPATPAQAKAWAQDSPFDEWVLWASEWLPVEGKPTVASVRRAYGPIAQYDANAIQKVLDYLDLSVAQQISTARELCALDHNRCVVLANLLLRDHQEAAAIAVFEKWIATARDRVGVANNLVWPVRYYQRLGDHARAEELAKIGERVYSGAGLENYAYLMDAQGREEEASRVYHDIADRYDDYQPLGVYTVRKGLRQKDKVVELQGWEFLRRTFPSGPQPLTLPALDAIPVDGVVFISFGKRAAATGLKATDVIVGVDGWRVRNHWQFTLATKFSQDEAVTYTVWRNGKYTQLHTRVPERYMGVSFGNYEGRPAATR